VSILVGVILILSSIWSVHRLKGDLNEKQAILRMVQSASDEIKRLREALPPGSAAGMGAGMGGAPDAWPVYFETVAMTSGVDKSNLSVSSEKPGAAANPSGSQSKELLYDLTLQHVSIKQVVRYAFSLENGSKPIKLRHLSIDTKGDPEGYMDATLSISA